VAHPFQDVYSLDPWSPLGLNGRKQAKYVREGAARNGKREPKLSGMNLTANLPSDEISARGLALVAAFESKSIINHSIRSYLFAKAFADSEQLVAGDDYDENSLFFACLFHDLGIGADAPGRERYEVEGADLAADFLCAQGWEPARVDGVWEAIALHTSEGIAERRSVLTKLTRAGISMDFGARPHIVSQETDVLVHSRYPRLGVVTALVNEIVAKASTASSAAPLYSFPGELVRERLTEPHLTRFELEALSSRWPD
jgi:hypothetical protein